MKYTIPKGKKLILHADDDDVKQLREDVETDDQIFDSDEYMNWFLQDLVANSELDWVNPEEVWALTDAPILGIRDEDDVVTHAWAWMKYEHTSIQESLLKTKHAVLKGGCCMYDDLPPLLDYMGYENYCKYLKSGQQASILGIELKHLSREDLLVIIGYLDKTMTKVTGILENT